MRHNHQGRIKRSVGYGLFKSAPFKRFAVLARFCLARGKQFGECADNGGMIPAVGFALENVFQAFQRDPLASAVAGGNLVQNFLLGFGKRVRAKISLIGRPQVHGDVFFGIIHIPQHAHIGIGAVKQFGKSCIQTAFGIGCGDFQGGLSRVQLRIGQHFAYLALKRALSLVILRALGLQNALDRFRNTAGQTLARIFFSLSVKRDVAHEPVVRRKNDHKLAAAGIPHLEDGGIAGIVVERRYHIDCEFMIPAAKLVVKFLGKSVVLAVAVADLACSAKNAAKNIGGKLLHYLGIINFRVLDFRLDVLFLIGQVFVNGVAALDIGLAFQFGQGILHIPFQGGDILVHVLQQQHADIAHRGLELRNVFDQEEGLENAQGKLADLAVFRLENVFLDL